MVKVCKGPTSFLLFLSLSAAALQCACPSSVAAEVASAVAVVALMLQDWVGNYFFD